MSVFPSPEHPAPSGDAPRVVFACNRYGEAEKVYLERQFAAWRRVAPHVLAWEDHRDGGSEPLTLVGQPWAGGSLVREVRSLRRRLGFEAHAAPAAESRALADRLAVLAPDVVYAHTGFVGIRVLPATRRAGIPLVMHLHGITIHRADREPRLARLLGEAIEASDHVIVVANYMQRWIAAQGLETKHVSVIPMGAPIATVPPRDATSRPAGEFRLLAVGRLVPYKGFDRAIDAVAAVRDRFPHTRLRIVGDGPERQTLERRIEQLELTEQVELVGIRPPEETARHLEWCDLVIHPASDDPDGPEAASVVIAEAMAHGRPVLSTHCGGIPDQIISGKTGILVAQHDRKALTDALEALLSDDGSRRRLGDAARQHAALHFDATRLAERVEDTLLEVAARRSAAKLLRGATQ